MIASRMIFRLTYTSVALLVMGGLLVACNKSPGPGLVDTNARVPDPCGLVAGSTADFLVGVTRGANTSDPRDRTANVANVSCEWRTPDDVKPPKKGGLIIASVSVELKAPKGHVSRRKFVPAGTKCVALDASSCWYTSKEGIVVVVHKGHSDVSIRASGSHSPGLEKSAYPTTAKRLADDVLKAL